MVYQGFLFLTGLSQSVSITLTQALLIAMIIMLGVKRYKKEISFTDCPYIWFLLFMFFATVISTIFGIDPSRSLKKIDKLWISLFFVAGFFLVNMDNKKFLFYGVITGGFLAGVFGTYQYIFIGGGKSMGFLTHPLTYGNSLAMILVLAYTLLITKTYDTNKERVFLMLAVLFIALGLSFGSRGPFGYGLMAVCLVTVIYFGKRGIIFGGSIAVLGVIFVFAVPSLRDSFMLIFSDDWVKPETSFGTRLVLWKASIEAISENPFFGTGYKSFDVVRNRITENVGSMAHAHNSYLQYLVLHGFFGLFTVLLFFGRLIYGYFGVKNFSRNPYCLLGIGVLAAFMLEGLTEHNFYDSEVAMLFYLLTGTAAGLCVKYARKSE